MDTSKDRDYAAPDLRARIHSGKQVTGFLIKAPSPEVVELCALAGADFAVMDAEHGPIDARACLAMVRAAESRRLPALVRLPNHDGSIALPYLDSGVAGAIVPSVTNRESLTEATSMLLHVPNGRRGLAGSRWASWGLAPGGLTEAMQALAEHFVVIVQIEHHEALDALDELLSEERVDVFLVGPADLSASLGIPGRFDDPRLLDACEDAVHKIVDSGRVAGMSVREPSELERWAGLGVRYFIGSVEPIIVRGLRSFIWSS